MACKALAVVFASRCWLVVLPAGWGLDSVKLTQLLQEGVCTLEGLQGSAGTEGVTGQQVLRHWPVNVEPG